MANLVNKVFPVYSSSLKNKQCLNATAVELASDLLRSGRIVALPTDTIYGVACSAQNNDGLDELYRIKKRDPAKPVAICVAEVEDVAKWSKVTVSENVLNELLPGPVTLVFERLNILNSRLNPETDLIGIRIPDNDFIRAVARLCDFPIALTSANISTLKSSLQVDEFRDLWPSLGAIFDGGLLGDIDPDRLGSTVVDLSLLGHYKVIRNGCAHKFVRTVLKEKYKLTEL
ncbi:YrdC domain-containing protein, mitochondrial [Halotydeus destructor]|nr:YrdC domain-containing protein, mitochondrial [Halotydeus destructor]